MNLLSMKLFNYALKTLVPPVLFLLGIGSQQSAYAKDNLRQNVRITMTVLAPPCVIKPQDKTMEVNFGNIINRDLYLYHRTPSQQFRLHLEECDPRMAQKVKIRFVGKESREQPGLLAFSHGSSASGAAIGMEKLDGTPLPFNKTAQFRLFDTSSNNVIPFQAYVKADPSALLQNKIGVGEFNAMATFELSYE
ncbi:fimbrial protein [Xenorhabdus cabanillasii]|uniref:Fimbrial adaptor n=1 Tax=Xenorhabdus cabanillasii JM26 TaxID=1427517 RepID=W1J5B2_9GAMM|nr:fimbrial protein [Xenorhabdus cabanillasii]PHM77349.1 Fimbrial adaptor, MrxG [Xenorhabdus cabanillasii JM26]CDL85894.1 putative fimbrial adaptor [Xenorhabdus cabanillasii JM26]